MVVSTTTLPLEKDIQRMICEYLTLEKYFFWRVNNIPVFGKNNAGMWTHRAMGKYSPKGISDIIMLHKGRFIAMEVKRAGCKLRPEQAEFAIRVTENGGLFVTVHSLEEVQEFLTKIL